MADDNSMTPVDLNLINDLWVPNVFIYNLKTFKVIYFVLPFVGHSRFMQSATKIKCFI